jgi:hypothetical protein
MNERLGKICAVLVASYAVLKSNNGNHMIVQT